MPRQPVYPKGLAVRGKRLWRDVAVVRPRLGPGERVLLEEACRLVDRLESLNAIIIGADVPEFETSDGQRFVVVVDSAQQEARLSTIALRQVMMSLGLDKLPMHEPKPAPADPDPDVVPTPAKTEAVDPVDEITRRRAERRGTAG